MSHEPPAWRALIDAAVADGADAAALRALLHDVRAHPELIGHARIFACMAAILQQAQRGDFGALPALPPERLRQWLAAARWAADWTRAHAADLRQHPLLAPLLRGAAGARGHPLMRHGIRAASLVSALWNEHEHEHERPGSAAAQSLARLQGHLLLGSLALLRDRHSSAAALDALPSATLANAALVVRECSLARAEPLLAALPVAQDTATFLQTLAQARREALLALAAAHSAAPASEQQRHRWALYLRYLIAWAQRCAGRVRPRARRRRGGGRGPRQPVHGWVGLIGPALRRQAPELLPPQDEDEEALWWYDDLPRDERELADVIGQEQALGASPLETAEPLYELLDARACGARLFAGRWGQPTRQSAAQRFGWDWRVLTPWELQCLGRAVRAALDAGQQRGAAGGARAQAGALVLVALLLGRSLEQARTLRWRWVHAPSAEDALVAVLRQALIDAPTLLCWGPPGHEAAPPEPLGCVLPALQPRYRVPLPEAVQAWGEPVAAAVFLPGATHWWALVLRASGAPERARPHSHAKLVFSAHPSTLDAQAQALLQAIGEPRITPQRIAQTMPAILLHVTGDASCVWLTLAQTQHAGEPRLHYTQHTLAHIAQAWTQGCARLAPWLAALGPPQPANAPHPSAVLPPTPAAAKAESEAAPAWPSWRAGARFVLQEAWLQALVRDTQRRLATKVRSWAQLREYHETWVFYTVLLQLLCTGMRAQRDLLGPWQAWRQMIDAAGSQLCALSDKAPAWHDRTRVVWLPAALTAHFAQHRRHLQGLQQRLAEYGVLWPLDEANGLAVFDGDAQQPALSSVGAYWMGQQLARRLHTVSAAATAPSASSAALAPGADDLVPPNFARARLRSRLLGAGMRAEVIDAYLGHARQGEWPWGPLSTFDWRGALADLCVAIEHDLQSLGIVPLVSALAAPTRSPA